MGKCNKKHIYCNRCGNVATWYKKGKKRVLVCPKCGILAHNPIPWSLIGGAVGSIVPGVGTAIGAGVGGILESMDTPKTEKKTQTGEKIHVVNENKLKRSDLIINQVLEEK